MSQVDLLDALAVWYEAKHAAAAGEGIQVAFGRTEGDRPKHSAWVNLECQERLGELIVWDTGEAEYLTGREGEPEVMEHLQIDDLAQLHETLERLVESIGT